MHPAVVIAGLPDQNGPHHGGMIAGIGARPFQRQLVHRIQMPPPREIAAQQRTGTRTDDELVSGIIAATAKHRALHFGQNIALIGTGAGEGNGMVQRIIRQFGGAAVHRNLGGRFDAAQGADQVRRLDQSGQGAVQQTPVAFSQANRVALISNRPGHPQIGQ